MALRCIETSTILSSNQIPQSILKSYRRVFLPRCISLSHTQRRQPWRRFLDDYDPSDTDASDAESMDERDNSSSTVAKTKLANANFTETDLNQITDVLIEQSLESLLHDILLDIYHAEKTARIESAVVEIEDEAKRLEKEQGQEASSVETDAAVLEDGQLRLKGNPFKTVKTILCPNCRLPRLMYPRVGFNSKPPPDSAQQYCKNEPVIIIDKHDVHGQRKKGVKVKGQTKGKNKKKADPGSPTPSEKSDPSTPNTNSQGAESFEFKEIEIPAAKCPNRDSHLGDHWKAVNVFATHLTGACYLKRDRAAGREAHAKISGTPQESRASSPKPTNGTKRGREGEDVETSHSKKKQKLEGTPKKNKKFNKEPSRLREAESQGNEDETVSQTEDTIQVSAAGNGAESGTVETVNKAKTNGVPSKKKPGKLKRASVHK